MKMKVVFEIEGTRIETFLYEVGERDGEISASVVGCFNYAKSMMQEMGFTENEMVEFATAAMRAKNIGTEIKHIALN
jgi:hypothetical protein